MPNLDWSRLNHLQLGRYAEYLVKMGFASYGFEIYTSEVDDHGVDFVIKKGSSGFFEVQVKSSRNLTYIFFPKATFNLRRELLAVVVLFLQGEHPHLFLIPSLTWRDPRGPFVSHDYEGKKSLPEWGLNLSKKSRKALEAFAFDAMVAGLVADEPAGVDPGVIATARPGPGQGPGGGC